MSTHDFQAIQKQLAQHIRNPDKFPAPRDIEDRRAKIYSDLFFNNVEGFVSRAFPVLKSIMGEQNWLQQVRDFFEKHACESPYFSDISREFLSFLQNQNTITEQWPFALELAHYEWCELALEISKEDIPEHAKTLNSLNNGTDFEQQNLLFSPLAYLLHYQWPVHHIAPDAIPTQEQDCFLIMYRNNDEQIQFMETNALSARLLAIIQENREAPISSGHAIAQLHAELPAQHKPELEVLIDHGTQTLKSFAEKNILYIVEQ